jgi:hypothetical protein
MQPAYGVYDLSVSQQPGRVALKRSLTLNGYYFKPEIYHDLRSFFAGMRKADEQQMVLQR